LLKTNKELFIEGRVQRHCVGTYEWEVNRGACAIFTHEGYTGELRYIDTTYERRLIKSVDGTEIEDYIPVKPASLRLNQFRGYRNKNAPHELNEYVYGKLEEFNEYLKTAKQSTFDSSNVVPSKAEWFMRADNRIPYTIFHNAIKKNVLPPIEMGEIIGRDVQGDEMAWEDIGLYAQGE
jgi:hypothetical protein